MQYRCPKCQSTKIMPISQGADSPRPNIPKSLVLLVPAIFILLILVLMSVGLWVFGNGAGQGLQIATVIVFLLCAIAAVFFWRDLPDFKISMQAFMQAQKHWKCRDCQHELQN